jgi:hypothetical protein
MPMLRSHRRLHRDKRARAANVRKRRNLVKFIPEADRDFAFTALGHFALPILKDPAAFGLTQDDAARIAEVVHVFRDALAKTLHRHTRNPQLVLIKDEARRRAEDVVRRYANIIRANPDVSSVNKLRLRLKARPQKLRKRTCPKQPPALQFIGSGDGAVGGVGVGGGSGVHVLRYSDNGDDTAIHPSKSLGLNRRAKPDGAVRIEMYFDMVPPGEPVPQHPAERGWPKYLRSFTRNPIEVEFPIPVDGPKLIVYWARWADSTGEVGRWSKTCVARVEGWTSMQVKPLHELPGSGDSNMPVRSDARYYIAEREQVRERYLEQLGAAEPVMLLPSAPGKHEVSRRLDAAPSQQAECVNG